MSPADLTNPFGPSCCEAGGEPGYESAQPCGCDMGCKPKPHYCERHEAERKLAEAEACIRNLEDILKGIQS